MKIGFELYPPQRRGPRLGTVVAMPDGPGISATASRGAFFEVARSLRPRFALLLIDRRGTGTSSRLDCASLQRGRRPFLPAVAACGAGLGSHSDRYGAADVAHDIEAVRAALKIGTLDLYGTAYGAVDAVAYAVRFPARVRSLVLASPVTPVGRDPWGTSQVTAFGRAVAGFCSRSRSCSAQREGPQTLIPELVRRLRDRPLRSSAVFRDGTRRRIVIDEALLAEMARNTRGDMVTQGELTGAARALLRANDPAPLARLGAEASPLPSDADFGPPSRSDISLAAHTAAFCIDAPVVWDRSASPEVRRAQYTAARAALAPDRFAPFSVQAWTAGAFGR